MDHWFVIKFMCVDLCESLLFFIIFFRRQVLASILNESIYDSSISPDYDKGNEL